MNQFIHWLSMGKYACYVWPCYAVMMMVFLIHCLAIKWQQRRVYKQLQQWFEQ